jgi:hypothetical protein
MKNTVKTKKQLPPTLRDADLRRVSGGDLLPPSTQNVSINFHKI